VLVELGACVKTPTNDGTTLVCIAAQNGHVEVVRALAELGACVKAATNKGKSPVLIAAQQGHAKVIRLLAVLKADITKPSNAGWTPLAVSVQQGRVEATKALLLLGAPITIEDLKQCSDARGNTRQLRADLQAWAVDALAQHRTFHATFLFGCFPHPSESTTQQTSTVVPQQQPNSLTATITSECPPTRLYDASGARVITTIVTTATPDDITTLVTQTRTTNPCLPMLAGNPGLLEKIAAFVGIVVGAELQSTRAMGPAFAAIDWEAHDQDWDLGVSDGPG